MKYYDTHCHLTDERYDGDRGEVIKELEDRMMWIINVGYDLRSSHLSVVLAQKYAFMYAACGMHPHDAKDYDEAFEAKLKAMLKKDKVIALGEIGLDYHYDLSERSVQKAVFKRQLEIADELTLPVIIHSRDANRDTFDILKGAPRLKRGFVLHSFSQSVEMLKEYLNEFPNVYFSISGPVTFANADNLRRTVEAIPLDRLFVETDSPYLTPVPFRGKRNIPSNTKYVAEETARLKNITAEELIRITADNARAFFNIN